MRADQEQVLVRRDILAAYIAVIDRPDKLLEVCANAAGGIENVRLAVEKAFGLSTVAADAVLALQVRRFTPLERGRIQDELVSLDNTIT
jgi:DNA gyrase/topoisomerase IV subunit A